jgi:hypothetical protein
MALSKAVYALLAGVAWHSLRFCLILDEGSDPLTFT